MVSKCQWVFFILSTHLTSQSGGTSPNTWVSQAWRVDRSAELLARLMVDSGQAVCNNRAIVVLARLMVDPGQSLQSPRTRQHSRFQDIHTTDPLPPVVATLNRPLSLAPKLHQSGAPLPVEKTTIYYQGSCIFYYNLNDKTNDTSYN